MFPLETLHAEILSIYRQLFLVLHRVLCAAILFDMDQLYEFLLKDLYTMDYHSIGSDLLMAEIWNNEKLLKTIK